jgi:hypothetical protein
LLTDDDTLVILPLAHLLGGYEGEGDCPGLTAGEREAYRAVFTAGMLGYRLHTYHGLVRAGFGPAVERQVRERHTGMFAPAIELPPLLGIIEGAVGVGEVNTPTRLGEVVTPVEMNVALALLLGLPGSPHYVTEPGQRVSQARSMAADVDWWFADSLACARQDMIATFIGLTAMPGAGQRQTHAGQVRQ